MDSTPLADMLDEEDTGLWGLVGRCIGRFHNKGVVHSDLNARNILVASSGEVYLIDFDRAKIRNGAHSAFRSNLKRLHRSLEKFWPQGQLDRLEKPWSDLISGYTSEVENR